MKGNLVLVRLLLRWSLLQSILFLVAASVGVHILGGLAREALPGFSAEHWLDAKRLGGRVDLLLLILPTGLGVLCGEAVVHLLVCPFSFVLPDVRRRLVLGLLLVAGAIAVGVMVVFEWYGYGEVAGTLGAFSFLWFGLGTALADAYPRSHLRLTSLALFLVAVLLRDFLVAGVVSWPWLSIPLAVAIGGGYLWRLVSIRVVRQKAIGADHELGAEYGPPPHYNSYPQSSSEDPWSVPRMGTRTQRWIRAAVYETGGHGIGIWIVFAALGAVAFTAFVAFMGYWDGLRIDGSSSTAWGSVYEMLQVPSSAALIEDTQPHHIVAILVVVQILLFGMGKGFSLRRGAVYPLSRSHRARLAYWGNLTHGLVVVTTMGAAFFVGSEVMRWLAGMEARAEGLPMFARILLLALILHPVLGWLRLRYLEAHPLRNHPLVKACVVGIGAIGGGFLLGWLGEVWFGLEEELPVALLTGGILLLLVGSQVAFRQWLHGHFASCDLV